MDYRKIRLGFDQISKESYALLTEVAPRRKFENNRPTDVIEGYNYTIALPKNGYEKLIVKTNESSPSFTQEEIDASEEDIKVIPLEFEARFYKKGDSLELTAVASTMKEVK